MIGHFFKSVWAAAKYFLLGLVTAILTAPQTGSDSRNVLRQRILALFDRTLPTSTPHEQNANGLALDKQEYWENNTATAANADQHPVL